MAISLSLSLHFDNQPVKTEIVRGEGWGVLSLYRLEFISFITDSKLVSHKINDLKNYKQMKMVVDTG